LRQAETDISGEAARGRLDEGNNAMKRFDRAKLRGHAYAAVILLAVLAWPSEGWSQGPVPLCNEATLKMLMTTEVGKWAAALKQSWENGLNPTPIVTKYAVGAILLPTCSPDPAIGVGPITKYFGVFLRYRPEVTHIGESTPGGDCNTILFGSGLYTFRLNSISRVLQARYTYVFQRNPPDDQWRVTQHHSSLVPKSAAACP
jgi:hypothetical protein